MMVALYPPPELAHKLAIAGGEDPKELHVTLAFLGKDPVDVGKLRRVVAGWAAATPPVEGRITGLKLFTASKHSEGKMVTCAGVSAHELDGHRGRLVGALKGAGFGPAENFPFSPHLTLAYGDRRNIELPDHAVAFKNATLKVGDQRFDFPLHGQPFA
jgi:2'-5' RNA ligase